MRRIILVMLAGCLVLSLLSLTLVVPAKAGDDGTTPCPSSSPASSAVSSPSPTADTTASSTPSGTPGTSTDIVTYTGTLSIDADGDIILTTVDGDDIVVAPSGAFAPG